MQEEGKPKSRTEKCEVTGFRGVGAPNGILAAISFMAKFAKLLPKKGEPISCFG
jgi:xanthine dehydrogenase molybdopterin-binding subunit B